MCISLSGFDDTVKVHCCILELMSRQILKQITAEELFNTRGFSLKIFISCAKLKVNTTYIGQLQAGNGDRVT